MEPAIMTNEIVVYNKLSYGAIFPRRWADIPITQIRFKKRSFMSFLNRTRILSALI